MSNQDLPGPYWQDQDNAGYGDAWGGSSNGAPRSDSPWEDGAGFWRGSDRGTRAPGGLPASRSQDGNGSWGERARLSRGARRGARGNAAPADFASPADHADAGQAARHNGWRRNQARHNGRADDWADADYSGPDSDGADYGHAAGYRGHREPEFAGGRTGRFSQTADDLRNRLGLRGSALSRGKRGFGTPVADYEQDDLGPATVASAAARPDRGPYRGSRRAGAPAAAAGGGYGGPDGYADGVGGGRTALRDQRGDWPDDYGRGHGTGITQRIRPGGRGGGRGGTGGPGGRGGGWDGDDQPPRGLRQRIRHSWRTGSWWRHWSVKKVLGLIGGGLAGLILLGIGAFGILYASTSVPTAESALLKGVSSTVYFSDGKQLLGTFTNNGTNHLLLTTQQIPKIMNDAMVAAEDRHFYSEGGVSLTGIIRAAKNNLFGGGALQGASTITEQYVKNYYQSLSSVASTQSLSYKIKEVIVAIKIAHVESKSWILTQYLNTAPFGPTTYGVGAAALQYFNVNLTKPGAKLTPAQAAMLAAMPNNPAVLSPDPQNAVGYQMLVSRWQYVLNAMVSTNAISQQQANLLCANCSLAKAEKAFAKNIDIVPPGQNSGYTGYRFYLMDMVKSELMSKYHLTLNQIETSGLKITTTFNPSMLTQLNHAVYQNVQQMKIDARQGHGNPLPPYAHVGGALIDPKTGGILAIYGGPGVSMSQKACNKVLCWDNTAEIPHQPGSSFKPYVLATAVSEGMNAKTSILNAYSPICVPPDYPQTKQFDLSARISLAACSSKEPLGYWPATDSSSLGGIPVAEAAAISSNPGFMDLAHRVGIDNVIQKAASFGVGSTPYFTFGGVNDLTSKYGLKWTFGSGGQPPDQHPGSVTMSLGASGTDVTAIEQASTFATLAADGVFHLPHVIAAISGGPKPITVTIPSHQALSPAQAADEDYALSFDNQPTYAGDGATGYPAAAWNRPVIAKTGTTDTAQAAWFIGAVPQYALAVTLYTNQQCSQSTSACYQTLNNLPQPANSYLGGGFGGAWPATIWHTFMTSAFAKLPVAQLPTPDFGNPFVKWNQVPQQPKHKATCGQGQGGHDHGNGNGNGKKCQGCPQPGFGQPCGGNPSPTPTSPSPTSPSPTSPSPTPTCGHGTGQPCGHPSPTPTPTPTPSCSQVIGPPCQPSPGTQGAASHRQQAATIALIRSVAVLTQLQLAVEVRQVLLGERL